jgi:hypothetical protein
MDSIPCVEFAGRKIPRVEREDAVGFDVNGGRQDVPLLRIREGHVIDS